MKLPVIDIERCLEGTACPPVLARVGIHRPDRVLDVCGQGSIVEPSGLSELLLGLLPPPQLGEGHAAQEMPIRGEERLLWRLCDHPSGDLFLLLEAGEIRQGACLYEIEAGILIDLQGLEALEGRVAPREFQGHLGEPYRSIEVVGESSMQ